MSRSSKVIDLSVINSNIAHISYCFQDIYV